MHANIFRQVLRGCQRSNRFAFYTLHCKALEVVRYFAHRFVDIFRTGKTKMFVMPFESA